LPVPYFHVVYTLPSELRDIAYQNKRVVYNLLMKAAAETTLAIASDPKHLGARIGILSVLHTWDSAASRWTAHAGCPVDPASSCLSQYSPSCSAG
jgi:hypothetical protein